jgi:hypothetical protein
MSEVEESNEISSEVGHEVLEEETKGILRGVIAQLRKGMDLHKITLPTFVLEPRSMLERITDFMAHPSLILDSHLKEDPVDRFLDVVRYFLSGWHIRPKVAEADVGSEEAVQPRSWRVLSLPLEV